MNDIKLELLQKDIDTISKELGNLQRACDQLQELYQQRDNILSMIEIAIRWFISEVEVSSLADQLFEGNYGNENEIQLEKELDALMEERHYIEIAKIRWINSDNMIIDSLKCFDGATEKMKQFLEISDR